MPTYSIKAPDGKTYEIDGPEGATTEQVKAEVIRQHPHLLGNASVEAPAAAPDIPAAPTSYADALARGYMAAGKAETPQRRASFAQGLTDMPVAIGQLGSKLIPGDPMADFVRRREAAYQAQREPGPDVGRIMGGVTGTLPLAALMPAAPATMLGRLGVAAGTGAVVAPLMTPATGEDGFWQQKGEQALAGAVLGGGLSAAGELAVPAINLLRKPAGAVVDTLSNIGTGLFAPKRAAANALYDAMQGNAPDAVAALRATQGMPTTPGVTPTMTERLVQQNVRVPLVAAAEQGLPGASGQVNQLVNNVQETRAAAIQNQLNRAREAASTTQLTTGAQAPIGAQVAQELGQRQAALEAGQRSNVAQIDAQGQREPGQTLTDLASSLRGKLRSGTITPAYETAFALAGDAPINISPVIEQAQEIMGRMISKIKPGEAMSGVESKLQALQARATEAVPPQVDSMGMVVKPGVPAQPPTATLQELDDIRKAVNADINSASQSGQKLDPTKLRALGQLHKAIDEAVLGADALSLEAREAYAQALGTYRAEMLPRFKTGQTAKMLLSSSYNESKVLPENVVKGFLKEGGAQQFVTTYGQDPAAAAAMRNGVEDLFHAAAYDATTGAFNPRAAAAFLDKHAQALTSLDSAGVGATAHLRQVTQQATALAEGAKDLAARAKWMGGKDTQSLVEEAVRTPAKMDHLLQVLPANGRAALADEVLKPVAAHLDANNPKAALAYLQQNRVALKQAVGDARYQDALKMAQVHGEVETLQALHTVPAKLDLSAVRLTQNYTPQQLTDLKVVAEDLARQQAVTDLARAGRASPTPDTSKISTEKIPFAEISSPFNINVTIARGIAKILGKQANPKAAAILANWMYVNPDAAIASLEAKIAREAGSAARTATRDQIANAARNALAPLSNPATVGAAVQMDR